MLCYHYVMYTIISQTLDIIFQFMHAEKKTLYHVSQLRGCVAHFMWSLLTCVWYSWAVTVQNFLVEFGCENKELFG